MLMVTAPVIASVAPEAMVVEPPLSIVPPDQLSVPPLCTVSDPAPLSVPPLRLTTPPLNAAEPVVVEEIVSVPLLMLSVPPSSSAAIVGLEARVTADPELMQAISVDAGRPAGLQLVVVSQAPEPAYVLLQTLTVRLVVALWLRLPLVPFTVTVDVPVGVTPLVAMFSVEVPAEAGFGEKVHEAPAGGPLQLKLTEEANPPLPVIVTV